MGAGRSDDDATAPRCRRCGELAAVRCAYPMAHAATGKCAAHTCRACAVLVVGVGFLCHAHGRELLAT